MIALTCVAVERQGRENKWIEMKHDLPAFMRKNMKKFKQRVRKGIPDSFRCGFLSALRVLSVALLGSSLLGAFFILLLVPRGASVVDSDGRARFSLSVCLFVCTCHLPPATCRGLIWPIVCGATAERDKQPNLYRELLLETIQRAVSQPLGLQLSSICTALTCSRELR